MTTNDDIGTRLREERDRLGLSQAVFAERVDVGRTSQINYESGERVPDASYLAAAAAAGVDVAYVVTGARAGEMPEVIPKRARAILDLYVGLDAELRDAVDALVRVASKKATKSAAGALIGSQVFHGSVGQVVHDSGRGGDYTMNVEVRRPKGK